MDEEEMKQILLNHCKECHLREYTSCVECEEKFTKATNKVLNLIDKLQKELEQERKLTNLIIDDFQAENYFINMTNKEVRKYYSKREELK